MPKKREAKAFLFSCIASARKVFLLLLLSIFVPDFSTGDAVFDPLHLIPR